MKRILAAAVAVVAVAVPGTAHAATGPRCDVGGNPVIVGTCVFNHDSIETLHVVATATGLPGLATVHITIYELDDATHTYWTALECTGSSDSPTDTSAGCEASIVRPGPGRFACEISGSLDFHGTCDSTVTG